METTQEKVNIEIFQPNLKVMVKNFRQMVRVLFFMLKKNFYKGKLMFNLKCIMMKRSKIAGKAIHNLIYHSSATTSTAHCRSHDGDFPFPIPLDEYEFSCRSSPAKYPSFLHTFLKRKSKDHSLTQDDFAAHAVIKALENMLNSEAASPAFPGFGRSPAVRQLRITDSPFPLIGFEEDSHVDEAAEEFIDNFYKNLWQQNAMAAN